MTSLTRWDPFREMQPVQSAMRELMDRWMDESIWSAPQLWRQNGENFAPALDVLEDEQGYTVKASLPGVDPNDVEITLTNNVLTIKGQTKQENEQQKQNYHVRERRFGSFMRSVTLPAGVDADKVEATHEHGVLTLTLPKTETVRPKRINVRNTVNSLTDSRSTNGESQGNGHQS
jgi:HSP20 family protein